MVLQVETNLETIIQSEDEVSIAIKELRDDKPALSEKVESHEDSEEISPIIEQQIDTDAYEGTSYSIDIGYEGKSTKSWYESLYDANVDEENNSASVTTVYNQHEHERLEKGHEVAEMARQAVENNKFFIESHLDMNVKDARDSIKLFSPALWLVMYNGKIKFN